MLGGVVVTSPPRCRFVGSFCSLLWRVEGGCRRFESCPGNLSFCILRIFFATVSIFLSLRMELAAWSLLVYKSANTQCYCWRPSQLRSATSYIICHLSLICDLIAISKDSFMQLSSFLYCCIAGTWAMAKLSRESVGTAATGSIRYILRINTDDAVGSECMAEFWLWNRRRGALSLHFESLTHAIGASSDNDH